MSCDGKEHETEMVYMPTVIQNLVPRLDTQNLVFTSFGSLGKHMDRLPEARIAAIVSPNLIHHQCPRIQKKYLVTIRRGSNSGMDLVEKASEAENQKSF